MSKVSLSLQDAVAEPADLNVCLPRKRNFGGISSEIAFGEASSEGWAISCDFEATWVRWVIEGDKVSLTHYLDSCKTCSLDVIKHQSLPARIVQFVSSSRDLCATVNSELAPELVVLVGKQDVRHCYATVGRPLSGYLKLCRLLYQTPEQQVDMVADKVRTDFLHEAIAHHCVGKSVLEVGAGSGVLLAFAAKIGATRIDGVEAVAEALELAKETLKRNSLEEKVKLHGTLIEHFVSEQRWDVIVSESIGLMGLCEWMVMSVLVARKWLSPGGVFLPAVISLWACPVRASFAHRPYGVDMAHIVPAVLLPFRVPRDALLPLVDGEGKSIFELKFASTRPSDLSSRGNVTFIPAENCQLTAICVWFELSCDDRRCHLSTAPSAAPTHWQQALLSFHPRELNVKEGVPFSLQFDIFPSPVKLGDPGSDVDSCPLLAVGVCMRVFDANIIAGGQPFEATWHVPVSRVEFHDLIL